MSTNENKKNAIKAEGMFDNVESRNEYIGKVEVLDEIKSVSLIPEMECMTIKQVADYYKVELSTLRKCYQRNKKEIDFDGVSVKTPTDFRKLSHALVKVKQDNGKLLVQIDDDITLEIPNRGIITFSKAAVLRIGMLLRDSRIAQEVRSKLIDSMENKTKSTEASVENTTLATRDNIEVTIIDQRVLLGKDFKMYGTFDEPLFLAKDVAEWIDYAKTGDGKRDVSRMLSNVDEDEKLVRKIFVSGQNRNLWFLTENGLYEVLMQSRKPIAKEFKKQVKAILRDVRKHGAYMTPSTIEKAITNPDFIIQLATALKKEQAERKRLETINGRLNTANNCLAAKNRLLTKEVLAWTDRNNINAVVRKLSGYLNISFSYMWNFLYKELLYRYGISVKHRAEIDERKGGKKKALLDYIHDDEWAKLEATIAAICEQNDIDSNKFFSEAINAQLKQEKLTI